MALYSIGYATKPIECFLQQLHRHSIHVVADVRSVPYSRAFHDYNREALIAHLRNAGLRYVYLGEELGPRSKDPAHYDKGGQVQFPRLQQSELFLAGVSRLRTGLDRGFRIALLCAEKDPATCHRSLLIAHYFNKHLNMDIQHIDHEGNTEAESALESRLMRLTGIEPDMLSGEAECLQQAYAEQLRRVAYRRD